MTTPFPSLVILPSPEITPEKVWSRSLPKFNTVPDVISTLPEPSRVLIVSVVLTLYVAKLLTGD